ncbi:polyhydroxyalkanoate synthesis repressor PhaR [Magnetovibrio blakemorei]|uniref:Polyhydroxyalkanoate synthesis repressor PhaR n=1 Tax=Magnetovibrio blakemorei TaxID=28181 RepID=A0A1E5QC81_9PROT|nr:polyhydroxyalkanoate synthesis repressor PhaR [Magnetovibrio blakemorei]OEJ69609.1 polyhydroxyalkanoate synthesis repressor PhaR [Magnetovibrio blakemorei]
MADANRGDEPITIKKYANRRLYNTATSSYVTLDHLAQMVRDGVDFVVHDAKSGEDITRQVLTHIIVEEEAKGTNLLPLSFLRQLIALYGDSLQSMVPSYLEQTMHAFSGNQDHMRELMDKTLGAVPAMKPFEDMARKNMAMFENALKVFNPLAASGGVGAEAPSASEKTAPPSTDDGNVDDMRAQLDQLQKQLDKLSKRG